MLSTIDAAPVVLDEHGLAPATPVAAARKVVVLLADAATQAAMRAWCESHGFDLAAGFGGAPRDPSEFQFHLTLFATVEPSALPEQSHEIDAAYAVPLAFEALGADADTPTLLVADPDEELTILRGNWLLAAEAEPTYAEFKPHVSMSYAWDGTPALDTLPLPDFVLAFDRLEVRTLKYDTKAAPRRRIKGTLFDRLATFGGPPVEPLRADVLAVLNETPAGAALAAEHAEIADRVRAAHSALAFADIAVDSAARTSQAFDYAERTQPTPEEEARRNVELDAAIAHLDWVRQELFDLVGIAMDVEARIADHIAVAQSTTFSPSLSLVRLLEASTTRSASPITADLAIPAEVRDAMIGHADGSLLIAEHDRLIGDVADRREFVDSVGDVLEDLAGAIAVALVEFRIARGRDATPEEGEGIAEEIANLAAARDTYRDSLDAIVARLGEIEDRIFELMP